MNFLKSSQTLVGRIVLSSCQLNLLRCSLSTTPAPAQGDLLLPLKFFFSRKVSLHDPSRLGITCAPTAHFTKYQKLCIMERPNHCDSWWLKKRKQVLVEMCYMLILQLFKSGLWYPLPDNHTLRTILNSWIQTIDSFNCICWI